MMVSRLPGLSPRVRGNHAGPVSIRQALGSIPACAGEPYVYRAKLHGYAVYPRVCGGTAGRPDGEVSGEGLSPRVRGNPGNSRPLVPGTRSIPACAGEPASRHGNCNRRRVYPRVCGGTSKRSQAGFRYHGLSPRVRGNPVGLAQSRDAREVYPRVCGGTQVCPLASLRFRGLSPRVRGNQRPGLPKSTNTRSIPACAGEPPPQTPAARGKGVYPRVCGGTAAVGVCVGYTRGLSPRVRGNRVGDAIPGPGSGSIPACAGEPLCACGRYCPAKVYPRVCGGTAGFTVSCHIR